MPIAIGTRVRLVAEHGVGSVGDEGMVTGRDSDGRWAVEITNRADCTPVTKPLLGVPAEKLATDTRCR